MFKTTDLDYVRIPSDNEKFCVDLNGGNKRAVEIGFRADNYVSLFFSLRSRRITKYLTTSFLSFSA